jgi:hypothetical protein
MTISKKDIQLSPGVRTIGLSEYEAAKVWGISPTQFAKIDGALKPRARRLGDRKVYSRIELEAKFHELPFWDDDVCPGDEWSVN